MKQEDEPKIDVLDLAVRPYGCLRRSGIISVRHIFELNKEALMNILKSNHEYYEELKTRLIQRGFMLEDHPFGPFLDRDK